MILMPCAYLRGGLQVDEVGGMMVFRAGRTTCARLIKNAARAGYDNPLAWLTACAISEG